MKTEINDCTRCGKSAKTIFITRPQGMSWSTSLTEPIPLPRTENVCGDCMTDKELLFTREVGDTVIFACDTLLKDTALPLVTASLETVRAFFMVRCDFESESDSDRYRRAAVEAVGLEVSK